MKQINVGIIGTGWCGGIRAETCAANPLVKDLHIAETKPERLAEIAAQDERRNRHAPTTARCSTIKDIDAVMISATPETTHYPMARESLLAGKHVFLEKPIAHRAARSRRADRDSRAGTSSSSRSATRSASTPSTPTCKKAIEDGTLGKPVSALVSRHITRGLGKKITGRSKLSPAAMEATHDLDFMLWCLEPAQADPRLFAESNYGAMQESTGGDVPDNQWIMVTMDNGVVVRRRRRLEPAAGVSEFLHDLDRDDRHRRRALRRRQPPRRGAEHDEGRHAAADVVHAGRVRGPHLRGADGARDHAFPRSGRLRPAGAGHRRAGAPGDGGLHRRRPLGRAQRAGHPAAARIAR